MISEWIRFAFCAFFMIVGTICIACSIIGVFRFKYVLNRMHAAAIADSLGLCCIIISLCIASGNLMEILKLLFILLFMWITSPISGHLLSEMELYTNRDLHKHAEIQEGVDDSGNI